MPKPKSFWVFLAGTLSQFDTGSIVQQIDQTESDSYFRGVGLINGVPTVRDFITFDELDHVELPLE